MSSTPRQYLTPDQPPPQRATRGSHRQTQSLDILINNRLHLLHLLARLSLRGSGLRIRDLNKAVPRFGGGVFVIGPGGHIVKDILLFVVGDVAVFGGALDVAAVVVFGAVVDSSGEYVGEEEEEGEEVELGGEHLEGFSLLIAVGSG